MAVIFLGGALLAPWLYWLAQFGAGHWAALKGLAAQPFHRYADRSFLALAVLGLVPFLRSLGVRSWRDAGLGQPLVHRGRLVAGFGVGFVSLAVAATVTVLAGARQWDGSHSLGQLIGKVGQAGVTAIVVAVLEELIFRGGLFGALAKVYRWTFALFISSAVYAIVHFFERPPDPLVINWWSGLAILPEMLRGFIDTVSLFPGFINLTIAGGLLAWAYYRSGTLYFSIGLHAGWIFWLKSYGYLTREAPGAAVWFWGSGKLIDGWLALGGLALAALGVAKLTGRQGKARTE